MKRILSKVFFRVFSINYIFVLIFYAAVIYSLKIIFPFPEIQEALIPSNTACFSVLLGFYGFSRVLSFNPFHKGYLVQLVLSPWHVGKPLPYGPVRLCWIDGLVLAIFILLEFLFPTIHWAIPFIAFFAGYNLGVFLLLSVSKEANYILFCALAAPLFMYFRLNLNTILALLVALTIFGQWKIYCFLKHFPWNTPWWTEDAIEIFKKDALRRRIIRWPFKELCIERNKSNTPANNVVITLIVLWWLHTLCWYLIQSEPEITSASVEKFYIIPFIGIPFIRLVAYLVYRPPISLLGRFVTGRLIIPGYDKIYIAPLILTLVAVFVPHLLRQFGIPVLVAAEITFGLLVFLALELPPSYEKWHYTGQHHIKDPRPASQVTHR